MLQLVMDRFQLLVKHRFERFIRFFFLNNFSWCYDITYFHEITLTTILGGCRDRMLFVDLEINQPEY